jgi:uncharacterized protein YbbC (DUF1343 family)/CubicO group peptidase (beta-lactamase class C family)
MQPGHGSSFFHLMPAKFGILSVSIALAFHTAHGLAQNSGFDAGKTPLIKTAIENAISSGQMPGAVFHMERHGEKVEFVLGDRSVKPAKATMTADTVFDAASLTKVIATTTAVMILFDEGKVKLDAPVRQYIPEFRGTDRDHITVKQLLTHVSGLRPSLPRDPSKVGQPARLPASNPSASQRLAPPYVWHGYDAGIKVACELPLESPPGTTFRYSDINFILLGEMVRRVSGQTLDVFCAGRIFKPLKMEHSTFNPPAAWLDRIAPTENDDEGNMLHGRVHDPAARNMGGVAGHAGLFTCMEDLSRFSRMILGEGELDDARLLKSETVKLMTRVQTPPTVSARRGLGWDMDSSYSRPRGFFPDRKLEDQPPGFPLGSFGHTGFTGTSLWIDPFSKTFVIFLSSRLHPDGKGDVRELYSELGSLAAGSVRHFDFSKVVSSVSPRLKSDEVPTVLNGIDVLRRQHFAPLAGLKIGLITNHTGHDATRQPTIDLLASAPGVKLVALFSPEHGIRGALDQEKIGDTKDAKTGLPVFSLYGERREPSPEQLKNLDALVFDIQDIGCRFYTYISTMQRAMQAAAREKKKFFVLDRVNPIGGMKIEGPVQPDKESFVACHAIPLRHGMTVGELALMMNTERKIGADLTVIRSEGWSRDLWLDETGLPWTNPSPNMRSLSAATLYPGIGLLESAISVGRGTEKPFEIIGTPYVNDLRLAHEMNRQALPGVRFIPLRFTPTASTFKDKPCGGVEIIITDREKLNAVDVGLALACVLQKLHPKDFNSKAMDRLLLDAKALKAIQDGREWGGIQEMWDADLNLFRKRRASFLLY